MAGLVTLSVEVELGWGTHDKNDYGHLSADGSVERSALKDLLNVCDGLEIPISFDIVGHLFESECEGWHEGEYPRGWWSADPGTGVESDPLFYAPELVQMIQDADVNHEICTHTYSHILGDEVPPETLEDELSKVENLHREFEIPGPYSIVFPRHQSDHYDILEEHDICVVRTAFTDHERNDRNVLYRLYSRLYPDHSLSEVRRDGGIVETSCSPTASLTARSLPVGQLKPHWGIRAIPKSVRQQLHLRSLKSAVDKAIESDGHLHLWSHVYNISGSGQWAPLKSGLRYMAKNRQVGALEFKRMVDLAECKGR